MAIKLNGDTLQYDDLGGNVSTIATLSNDAFAMASGSQLEVANLHVGGNLTVLGTQALGDAEADSLTVTGDASFANGVTASIGITILDDQKLSFGTGLDATFEYDEDGNDVLLYDGADMRFGDDIKLGFGAAGDVTIEYDENGDDVLQIAGGNVRIGHGAATQLQFRDSAVHISSDADGYLNAQADTGVNLNIGGTDVCLVTSAGLNVVGTLTGDTSLTIDAITLTDTELGYLDGLTLGTAAASKVMTWDASSDWTAAGGTCANLGTVTTVDINGGNIDGTIIGAASVAAGSFAALVGTTGTFSSNVAVTGTLNVTGDVTLNGALIPDSMADGVATKDLGSSANQWKDLYVDGVAYLDEVDIDAGAIDGTTIGANAARAGTFTDLTVSGKLSGSNGFRVSDNGAMAVMSLNDTDGFDLTVTSATISSNMAVTGTLNVTGNFVCDSDILPDEDGAGDLGSSSLQWAEAHIDTGHIDTVTAVNVDGILGANSAAAATVTTLSATGDVDLGDATSDTITATGRFDSDLVPSTDSARDLGTSALQWADAHIDHGYIDAITATGTSTLTTVDINGGNIDGTIIGAASVAAGSFAAVIGTTISGSTSVSAPTYTTNGGGVFVVDADADYLTFNTDTATFANDINVKALSFITYSDATLKQDIKPLDSALDKVMSMRGVSYEFKNQTTADGATHREVGFLAQEMKQTVPEVVYGSGDGNLGIDYAKLTSVLVEAVKSQQGQIEELRAALLKK